MGEGGGGEGEGSVRFRGTVSYRKGKIKSVRSLGIEGAVLFFAWFVDRLLSLSSTPLTIRSLFYRKPCFIITQVIYNCNK